MKFNINFKKTISLIAISFFFYSAFAQVTILLKVPSNTPINDSVFVAGDFNNWNPGNSIHKLTKVNDSIFTIILPARTGTILFKFTRGEWPKGEVTKTGGSVANRSFTFGNGQTINLSVGNWEDLAGGGGGQHTANANVSIMSPNFFMPQLNRTRRIWIYLPTDYSTSTKTYPVIYMHDGQNLFDAFYSFSGEWGVDESLAAKQNLGDFGAIVIGIDNGGSNRMNELNPWVHPLYGGGQGNQYLEFIVNTLKPYVDSAFRTKPDRLNTGIAGSSMGGLISLYGGIKYQNTFGKVGVFSPAFWIAPQLYSYVRNAPIINTPKIFIIGGGKESANLENEMIAMVDTLNNTGYPLSQINYQLKPDGQHSEWFWKREFPAVYSWLFSSSVGINENKSFNFSVYPNPAKDEINIKGDFISDKLMAEMSDSTGKLIFKKKFKSGKSLELPEVSNGVYILKITDGKQVGTRKILIQD